jgi:hypothetical protein
MILRQRSTFTFQGANKKLCGDNNSSRKERDYTTFRGGKPDWQMEGSSPFSPFDWTRLQ